MPDKRKTSSRSQNTREQGRSTSLKSPRTVKNEVKNNKSRVAKSGSSESTKLKSQNAIEQQHVEKPALIELEERKAELSYSPQESAASNKKKVSHSGTQAENLKKSAAEESSKNSATPKKSGCTCCCGTFGKALLTLIIVLICCTIAVSYVKRYRTITTENSSIGDSKLSVFTIFDNIKIKICDDEFSHDALRGRSFENGTSALLKKLIVPGDTVIEVDQNIGAQSLLTAKLIGQGGRIYYFNPYRKYVEALQESSVLNDFQNRIFVYPFAISDQNSDGLLVYKTNFPIMSGKICKKTEQIEPGYSAMAIKISSLDEQLPNLQKIKNNSFYLFTSINLLKINVNGNEADVLRGALNLIRKSDNINIICSYERETFGSFALLESFLMDGFLIYLIDSEGGATRITLSELQKMQKCDILLRRYIPEPTVL